MLKEIGADVRGICTRPYIIGITGNLIYKALKKRLVSGVILLGTLFYLGNRAFHFDIQGATIAAVTLFLAVAGFAAQKWGNWALKRSLLHAEAHGANLLENKKRKRFISRYLPDLYTHVYQPEAVIKHEQTELITAAERHQNLFKHLLLDRLVRYSNTPEAIALIKSQERADILAKRFTAEASEKLRRLRLHHQLALFEYVDTLQQVTELAFDGQDAEAAGGPGTIAGPGVAGKNA